MGEKFLTEADWKKFAKSRDYKDAALLKALAALDKAERTGTAEQLAALDEIDKQAEALLKVHKSDKELAAYLDDLDKALKRQRKSAEQAARAEAEQAEDEDDESPALLSTKMVPLLRQVAKGEVMKAMIALAGKDTVVLVSRKAVGPAQRKLLTAQLGSSAGAKFVLGECLFEANAHTFVVQAQAGGLAKKLKAALLEQTGQRFKVRVRGVDPDDVDEDGEDGEPDADAADAPKGAAATPEQQAYEARLARLEPALQQPLRDPKADSGKLRALSAFAREKAESGNHKAALAALDSIEAVLRARAQEPQPASTPPPAGKVAALNRLNALAAAIKTAAAGPERERVLPLFAAANGAIKSEELEQANRLLGELEALLKAVAARSKTGIPAGTVAKRQYLLTRWKQLPGAMLPELDKLIQATTLARPEILNLGELRELIQRQLQQLFDDLQDEIDRAINLGDMSVLKGLGDRVRQHQFMQHLLANPYATVTGFQASLLEAIRDVEVHLA